MQLLPLLITALELPDPALRANVIDTLGVLAKEVPAEVSGSVSSVVLKVLKGIVGETQAGSGAIVNHFSFVLRNSSLTFHDTIETPSRFAGVSRGPSGVHRVLDTASAKDVGAEGIGKSGR